MKIEKRRQKDSHNKEKIKAREHSKEIQREKLECALYLVPTSTYAIVSFTSNHFRCPHTTYSLFCVCYLYFFLFAKLYYVHRLMMITTFKNEVNLKFETKKPSQPQLVLFCVFVNNQQFFCINQCIVSM